MTIRIPGEIIVEYQVLAVLEFTSARKRMSAIVRTKEGKLFIYIKGADTMILERLAGEQPYLDNTLKHLDNYARDGLRTLCFAYRQLSEKEYSEWNGEYQKANTALTNRSGELEKVGELIEKDFFLVGATAVEDKLQDGVPETIHILGEVRPTIPCIFPPIFTIVLFLPFRLESKFGCSPVTGRRPPSTLGTRAGCSLRR